MKKFKKKELILDDYIGVEIYQLTSTGRLVGVISECGRKAMVMFKKLRGE